MTVTGSLAPERACTLPTVARQTKTICVVARARAKELPRPISDLCLFWLYRPVNRRGEAIPTYKSSSSERPPKTLQARQRRSVKTLTDLILACSAREAKECLIR